ncbi:nuclear speckle splicing regulatory protein 1 [Stomoxys calcitrans]|uniref:Nuclear speckle splicing regulatory protein 1 N-terminal domain-containing protein n=1 Tax=Stomoxys calcitrans TaxID=35570 RepID=A0A1I8PGM6_STOCA|nr:nuclear speckle splicing regulatory protein 1 [Stomoxys calcitrans]
MSKQYGLIIPGQQKSAPPPVQREVSRPSIFDESSGSDSEGRPLQMKMKKATLGPSIMERRRAKNLQEKALAEDPTIFQYDELYDDMENQREEEKKVKSNEPKKAKYITKLLETAERRKLENELRVERQVQKEREAEGEQFKDKEAFVTSSYRKKLEEMRKLEEQNKRDDYLEAIGDVRKQKDLDGFYRHLYEQKLGSAKEVKKPELLPEANSSDKIDNEESISYKPIKSGKPAQQRAYRKRRSSDEEVNTQKDISIPDTGDKKQHLTNNIDADSDFSIDDSSSDSSNSDSEGNDKKTARNPKPNKKIKATMDIKQEIDKTNMPDANKSALNFKSLTKEKSDEVSSLVKPTADDKQLPIPSVNIEECEQSQMPKTKPKDIWKKRTVGEAFDAAVQRYYERKAARSQA